MKKIIRWEDYKLKFFNISLFKISKNNTGIGFYLFRIRLLQLNNKIQKLSTEIKDNTNFDMKPFDKKIEESIKAPKIIYDNFSKDKIAYLATELYNTGGHTKCLESQIKSLFLEYSQCLFLSKMTSSINNAENIIKNIEKYSQLDGVDENYLFFEKEVYNLYKKIIEFGAKTLFVYIHPNDILGTAVLSLIKRTSTINIIFFNHASHYPNLGMSFADLILEGMPSAEKITHEKRNLNNTVIIGLQSKKENETIYLTTEEKQALKTSLEIKCDEELTISGGASYKFFEEDTSPYFEMIKEVLSKRKKLKHIVITKLKKNEIKIVEKIFKNTEEKSRLIFLPLSDNYEKYFQIADLYIDSFPVSSALTQIDLMRLKVPTTVKINTEKLEFTFHEYMQQNYPYMFKTVKEMKQGIIELLNNKKKREEIIKNNYNFWLKTYEEEIVKDKYINFINNLSDETKLKNFKEIPYELQLETLNWRNSPNVAKFFKIPYIEKETHEKWLRSLHNEQPNNIAFIIEYNKKPIGVTYFHSIDYKNRTFDWGIYIYEQELRGKHIGDKVLKQCIAYAQNLNMKEIYLDVLSSNTQAIKLYTKNNFKSISKTVNNFVRYKRELEISNNEKNKKIRNLCFLR